MSRIYFFATAADIMPVPIQSATFDILYRPSKNGCPIHDDGFIVVLSGLLKRRRPKYCLPFPATNPKE
jgi:hypothetical protein